MITRLVECEGRPDNPAYDAAGSFIGSGVVRAALTLDETGDHYTSTATNDVLDVNGNVIGSGCATSVSTRFQ